MFRVFASAILLMAAFGGVIIWLDSLQFFDRRGGTVEANQDQTSQIQANSSTRKPVSGYLLEKEADGHFYVDAWVNDDPVTFMVDTGASRVVLTRETASRLGFDLWDEDFDLVVRTAGGEVRAANIILDEINIGDEVIARGVPAVILMEGELDLLGMSFLSRISGYEVNGDEMFLRP